MGRNGEVWKSVSLALWFKTLDKDVWYQIVEAILGNYSWTKVPGLVGSNEIRRQWEELSVSRQTTGILSGNSRLS